MIPAFAIAVAVCAAITALWSFILAARSREPQNSLLVGLLCVEVLLVAQLVIGVILLINGQRPGSMATYLAYLIGALVILPLGTFWALAERSRSSTVILGIACLAIPVMVLRLQEVWHGAHA